MKPDYNRGLIKHRHAPTGVEVFMYADSPGVYINAQGTPISEEFAQAAGFDVEKFSKERTRREKLAAAKEAIDNELAYLGDEIKVVETRGDYRLLDIGHDRFVVEDADGQRLNPTPLPRATAVEVLNAVMPKGVKPISAAVKPKT